MSILDPEMIAAAIAAIMAAVVALRASAGPSSRDAAASKPAARSPDVAEAAALLERIARLEAEHELIRETIERIESALLDSSVPAPNLPRMRPAHHWRSSPPARAETDEILRMEHTLEGALYPRPTGAHPHLQAVREHERTS